LRCYSDPTASALFSSLQLHASQPYAKMLLRWITTGLLHDPYQEFMVKVDDTIEKAALETDFNDDYWERRYTVRRCLLYLST
jgi:gamma-tubulin complex component 2